VTAGPSDRAPAGEAPVGLIAAGGLLPVEIAKGARRLGREIVCVDAFQADPGLRDVANAYYTISLGELGGMIGALRRHAVREVVLAGKVDKLAAMRTVRLDAAGARAAQRMADLRDASILAMFVTVLEEAGFEVGSQTRYVGHLVPAAGPLGSRALTADEHRVVLDFRMAGRDGRRVNSAGSGTEATASSPAHRAFRQCQH
jgi:DUF1009 family protein